MQKHKKKGGSVQDLLGIKTFTRYGLATKNGEIVFFLVSPTNISVLSHASIEAKIHHLMMVLCTHPDIEIVCTDSQECFDANKAFLQERLQSEQKKCRVSVSMTPFLLLIAESFKALYCAAARVLWNSALIRRSSVMGA